MQEKNKDSSASQPPKKKSFLAFGLVERRRLTPALSEKSVYHLSLDLSSKDSPYTTGDAVALYCLQQLEEVQLLADLLGKRLDERLLTRFYPEPLPLKDLLSSRIDLFKISKRLVGEAIHHVRDASLLEKVFALPKEEFQLWAQEKSLKDLLIDYLPPKKPLEDFFNACAPLQPRFYSIASSPLQKKEHIDLLVEEVKGGFASSFLCQKMEIGEKIEGYFHESPHFRLPQAGAPIIMVGPGTGLAPFMGFLQERVALEHSKNWLFFGERHGDENFYFKEELLQWQKHGFLDLDCAWSRATQDKVYVQHLIYQKKELFYRWMEEGAHLYICGDAKKMARDVEETVLKIIREQSSSEEAAREKLSSWVKEGRYSKDVY